MLKKKSFEDTLHLRYVRNNMMFARMWSKHAFTNPLKMDVCKLMSLGLSWTKAKVKGIKCNPKLSRGFRDEASLLKYVFNIVRVDWSQRKSIKDVVLRIWTPVERENRP